LSELAGTGRVAGEEWNRTVSVQQGVLNGVLFDDRPRVNLRVPINGSEQYLAFDRHPAPRFRDLPQFEPPRLDGRTRLKNAQTSLIGLAVWTLLSVLMAIRIQDRL
jgi:hypothetical protein